MNGKIGQERIFGTRSECADFDRNTFQQPRLGTMTRPIGVSILSGVMGWLAIAGIGNALVWNIAGVQEMFSQIPAARALPRFGGLAFTLLALACAVSAAATCIALWRMRPWAARAYGTWCVAVLCLGIWMALQGPAPTVAVGMAFAAGLFGFVALAYPYVASQTAVRAR
jgi:hypothetical protein